MRSLQPWAITIALNPGEADRLLPFEEPGSTSRNSPQSQEFAVDLRTVHEVRIHLPPPASLNCRETPLHSSESRPKCPQFCVFHAETGLGESVLLDPRGKLCGLFLWRANTQSGLTISVRRMQCDHRPIVRRMQT